jgi:glucosamine-6-phosphate deaminase
MMNINISCDSAESGRLAADLVSGKLKGAILKRGEARMIVSTGSSQFDMFRALVKKNTDWTKVEVFHLDEYIGLPVTHPASFRKYLQDLFCGFVNLRRFHSIDVEEDIGEMIARLTEEIRKKPVDLGLIGIGVNGHIAFNDPPADFETTDAFRVVRLAPECKRQQVDEGWFESVEDVPDGAVSMTVFQIMQCDSIISCVPHKVKADAIHKTFTSGVTSLVPATILKQHHDFNLFLDRESASRIITF